MTDTVREQLEEFLKKASPGENYVLHVEQEKITAIFKKDNIHQIADELDTFNQQGYHTGFMQLHGLNLGFVGWKIGERNGI